MIPTTRLQRVAVVDHAVDRSWSESEPYRRNTGENESCHILVKSRILLQFGLKGWQLHICERKQAI
jgi:hypothetical protein